MQIIVGDRLAEFAKVVGGITYTNFLTTKHTKNHSFTTGQGLSVSQMELLADYCEQHDLRLLATVSPHERAGAEVTHKARLRNGLISKPQIISPTVLEAELLIDEENELLIDHSTGCHVQGMVLIEAIRQMFIAAAEVGENESPVPHPGYAIFNSLEVRFHAFAFPVAATIRHTTTSSRVTRSGGVSFTARVEVLQNGICVTSADVSYSIFSRSTIEPMEEHRARVVYRTFTTRAIAAQGEAAVRRAPGESANSPGPLQTQTQESA